MPTTPARTFAIRGTYPDGVVRHEHVTTGRPVHEVTYDLLTGFLPFAKVEVEYCGDIFHCSHDWAHAATITLDPATR